MPPSPPSPPPQAPGTDEGQDADKAGLPDWLWLLLLLLLELLLLAVAYHMDRTDDLQTEQNVARELPPAFPSAPSITPSPPPSPPAIGEPLARDDAAAPCSTLPLLLSGPVAASGPRARFPRFWLLCPPPRWSSTSWGSRSRAFLLLPRPDWFRRTWLVKALFSSVYAHGLAVATYEAAVYGNSGSSRVSAPSVIAAAFASAAWAVAMQWLAAVLFIQCRRAADVLQSRLIEVSFAPRDEAADRRVGVRAVAQHVGGPGADRTRLSLVRSDGQVESLDVERTSGRAASRPPNTSDDEARELLRDQLHAKDWGAAAIVLPVRPSRKAQATMCLCWAAQFLISLAELVLTGWLTVTNRLWKNHHAEVLASLAASMAARIFLLEPLSLRAGPTSCLAGRLWLENAFGTHRWERHAMPQVQPARSFVRRVETGDQSGSREDSSAACFQPRLAARQRVFPDVDDLARQRAAGLEPVPVIERI